MPIDLTLPEPEPEIRKTIPEKPEFLRTTEEQRNKNKIDMINHPPHYTFGKFEVIDVLMDWFSMEPLLWQVVKYIARAQHKGNFLEDLKKSQFYLNKRIEIAEQGMR
jgi:hypothetical protein